MVNINLREKALELERAVRLPPGSSVREIEAALVSVYNAGVEASAAQLDAVAEVFARNGVVEGAAVLIEQVKVLRGPALKLPGAP